MCDEEENTVKKILLLILAVAVAVVCASCAKKVEAKTELYSFNIYNRAGGDVTEVSVKDNASKEESKAGRIADGSNIGLSVTATLDGDNNPNLSLSYTDADGSQYTQTLAAATKTTDVTLQAGGTVEYGAPEA